jgi:hypothetical protein
MRLGLGGLKERADQASLGDLPEFEFDRGAAAENVDRDPQFAALEVDLLDHADLAFEGTVGHLHAVAHLELDLRAHPFLALAHLGEHLLHLFRAHRQRLVLGAGETITPGFPWTKYQVRSRPASRLMQQMHVHDDVAGKNLRLDSVFLPRLTSETARWA